MKSLPPWLAGALVFFTSGAVLVLEILAGRLLAPYVGIRLETYTSIIGTVLAGISLGTWLGGKLADRVDPRRTLGPIMVVGGALAMLSLPMVRLAGSTSSSGSNGSLALAFIGFFPSAAVLSAVSPTVVKLQLRDLEHAGATVGRLSALGTAGAILGTFVAGFVLSAAAATSTIIITVGLVVLAAGLVLWFALNVPRPPATALVAGVALALGSGGLAAGAEGPCDVETRYHCARVEVEADPGRPGGRSLYLDILRHSYVDLDDPTHLELRYAKGFADMIDGTRPAGAGPGTDARLDTLHIGGGGFTFPRYLKARYPRSRHLVLEIDPDLTRLAEKRLGLRQSDDLRVREGDARLLMRRLPSKSRDLVLGDAFGDLAVPWHLTTREFLRDLHRILRPGGVYVLNLIDHPPLRFLKAEMATLAEVFEHVAVAAPPAFLSGARGGNFVVAASDQPFDEGRIAALTAARDGEEETATGAEAEPFVDDGEVLTDDYAPVDQWLAWSRRRG